MTIQYFYRNNYYSKAIIFSHTSLIIVNTSVYFRLRHGPLTDVQFLVDILPDIIVDFLPPMEVLQTVVTDFVSPHQTRPSLSAAIMNKVFDINYY